MRIVGVDVGESPRLFSLAVHTEIAQENRELMGEEIVGSGSETIHTASLDVMVTEPIHDDRSTVAGTLGRGSDAGLGKEVAMANRNLHLLVPDGEVMVLGRSL